MAKKQKLWQRLFSALLSFLLHGKRPPISSRSSSTALPPPREQHPASLHFHPPPGMAAEKPAAHGRTLVVDVDGGLLLSSSSSSSSSLFPCFMLVALEAGGILRGALLLLLYPVILCLSACVGGEDAAVRVMAMAAFCGLRENRFHAGRAVLPRWLMEDVADGGIELEAMTASGGSRVVCVTRRMPTVMVEGFLREYLGAEAVVGREMKVLWGFYTGLMEEEGHGDEALKKKTSVDYHDAVGFSGSLEFLQHPLSHCCKEIYLVTRDQENRPAAAASLPSKPRRKLKPLVFHDGRLAFLPTAGATLAMLTWLPFGVVLGAARLAVSLTVPYRYSTPILAATGMSWRLKGSPPPPAGVDGRHGQLFVCNHRTLIDPVYVSVALDRPVRAVSYSLSRLSELISPIGRTVRLTRDRERDGHAMARLLDRGDLVVVCPEGTTCREPYLLRFSPLFAELADDVVPVGIAVETAMFYATTAGGLKCLDPLYYMVNPRMCYTVQFMDRVRTAPAREGKVPSTDVANAVQRKMGEELGYGCTMLTRKDKYLMLAGNDGKCSSAPATAAAAGRKI